MVSKILSDLREYRVCVGGGGGGGGVTGRGGQVYWNMPFLYKIFRQNKMLCRPTIPSFFRAETHIYFFALIPGKEGAGHYVDSLFVCPKFVLSHLFLFFLLVSDGVELRSSIVALPRNIFIVYFGG